MFLHATKCNFLVATIFGRLPCCLFVSLCIHYAEVLWMWMRFKCADFRWHGTLNAPTQNEVISNRINRWIADNGTIATGQNQLLKNMNVFVMYTLCTVWICICAFSDVHAHAVCVLAWDFRRLESICTREPYVSFEFYDLFLSLCLLVSPANFSSHSNLKCKFRSSIKPCMDWC